jgi:hypothetical protein
MSVKRGSNRKERQEDLVFHKRSGRRGRKRRRRRKEKEKEKGELKRESEEQEETFSMKLLNAFLSSMVSNFARVSNSSDASIKNFTTSILA